MALNISKFLEQFFIEAEDKLSSIQMKMVDYEKNPKDTDSLISIQRDIHTIKGSSRMVGLKKISEIAHSLEDAIEALSSNRINITNESMGVLYRGIDMVSSMVVKRGEADPNTGDNDPSFDKVKEDLSELLTGKSETTIEIGKEKNLKNIRGKKKINLDFEKLRKNIKRKKKKDVAPQPEINELEIVKKAASYLASSVLKTDLNKKDDKVENTEVNKKEYLKIEKKRIDVIINKVTDILTKKYVFSNLLSNIKNIRSIAENINQEWVNFYKGGSEDIKNNDLERRSAITHGLEHINKTLWNTEQYFATDINSFEGSIKDLYDKLLELKLTPLSTIFNIYPRFVRDYGHRNNKNISIFIRGEDTEVDKILTKKINEPLVHLIRNSCDHGIEFSEERIKLGKPEHGTIIVEAIKKGNRVEIKVSDDGRGLDKDKIIETAILKEMITKKKIAEMDDKEIYNIIFEAGFSTSDSVSDTSGRGMGMNIVKKVLHSFGGSIYVETEKNKGTTFILDFPISIFTNSVLFVEEEKREYAIPSNFIKSIVKIDSENINERSGYSVIVHNDEIYTVAKLNQILYGESSGISDKSLYLIIPKGTEKKIGILVDNILYETNVIIKETGPLLGKLKYIFGLIIGNKGDIISVLDLHDLTESSEFSKKIKMITPPSEKNKKKKKILIVDDSILVREMEKNLLEGAGYEITTAINGLDGYNKAISNLYDLIVADVEMPEMGGLEMLENIKKIEGYAEIPTIVLSTVEKEEDKIRGLKIGANAWLQKQDFNDREFIDVIKSFIE